MNESITTIEIWKKTLLRLAGKWSKKAKAALCSNKKNTHYSVLMRVKAAKCEAEIKKIVVSNGAFPVDFSGCVWVFCATFVSARIVLLEFAFAFDYFVFCSFGPGHISGSNTRIKYFAVRIHSYTKRQSHGLIEVEQKCGWRHARVIYVTCSGHKSICVMFSNLMRRTRLTRHKVSNSDFNDPLSSLSLRYRCQNKITFNAFSYFCVATNSSGKLKNL